MFNISADEITHSGDTIEKNHKNFALNAIAFNKFE